MICVLLLQVGPFGGPSKTLKHNMELNVISGVLEGFVIIIIVKNPVSYKNVHKSRMTT